MKPKPKKQLMSKKAARSAAERDQAKKKSQPKLSKKVLKAVDAALTGPDVPAMPKAEVALRFAANTIIPEIREHVKVFADALAGSVLLDKKLQDARERELWKYCDTPFKSWNAFVLDLKKISGKSAATLFGMIGLQKALPESTAEQRRAIGPRKGAKVAKAAKVAKKKGQTLPPEIIEKAGQQTEAEFDKTIHEAGFSETKKAEWDDGQDNLLSEIDHGTHAYNPRVGGSGVVEGNSGEAQQLPSVVAEAIEAAKAIHDSQFTEGEALKFICEMWLKSECDHADYGDMNNRQALAETKMTAHQRIKRA